MQRVTGSSCGHNAYQQQKSRQKYEINLLDYQVQDSS